MSDEDCDRNTKYPRNAEKERRLGPLINEDTGSLNDKWTADDIHSAGNEMIENMSEVSSSHTLFAGYIISDDEEESEEEIGVVVDISEMERGVEVVEKNKEEEEVKVVKVVRKEREEEEVIEDVDEVKVVRVVRKEREEEEVIEEDNEVEVVKVKKEREEEEVIEEDNKVEVVKVKKEREGGGDRGGGEQS